MKTKLTIVSIMFLMLTNHNSWAYGGGGSSSSKSCAKPRFSEFVPAEQTDVKPGAAFEFTASSNTYPESIKVTIKDLPVPVQIEDKKGNAFKVSGKLPNSLASTYARININAEAANACKGSGGWLVKIGQ